jgi:hypothetical protein
MENSRKEGRRQREANRQEKEGRTSKREYVMEMESSRRERIG